MQKRAHRVELVKIGFDTVRNGPSKVFILEHKPLTDNSDFLIRRKKVNQYNAQVLTKMLLYVAVFLFGDGMQMPLTGIITGAGKQRVTGPVLIAAYFVIGLPVGAGLAFAWPRLGLLGVWLGMTLAVYLHMGSYFLVA